MVRLRFSICWILEISHSSYLLVRNDEAGESQNMFRAGPEAISTRDEFMAPIKGKAKNVHRP